MVVAVFFWVSLLFPQSPMTMIFTSLCETGIGFHLRTTGRLVGCEAGLVVACALGGFDFVFELTVEFCRESAPQPTNRTVRKTSDNRCMLYPHGGQGIQ